MFILSYLNHFLLGITWFQQDVSKQPQPSSKILLGADEVNIRWNQFDQVHHLLEDELVLSEELVLSDTFEHRPQYQKIEFRKYEEFSDGANQDSNAK